LKWQKESCIAVSLIIPEREIVLIPKAWKIRRDWVSESALEGLVFIK
jgi:hypothetical protein